eukprot:gene39030-46707_t
MACHLCEYCLCERCSASAWGRQTVEMSAMTQSSAAPARGAAAGGPAPHPCSLSIAPCSRSQSLGPSIPSVVIDVTDAEVIPTQQRRLDGGYQPPNIRAAVPCEEEAEEVGEGKGAGSPGAASASPREDFATTAAKAFVDGYEEAASPRSRAAARGRRLRAARDGLYDSCGPIAAAHAGQGWSQWTGGHGTTPDHPWIIRRRAAFRAAVERYPLLRYAGSRLRGVPYESRALLEQQ